MGFVRLESLAVLAVLVPDWLTIELPASNRTVPDLVAAATTLLLKSLYAYFSNLPRLSFSIYS